MTTIAITKDMIVCDQKVYVLDKRRKRHIVYKDKMVKSDSNDFIISFVGEVDFDITGEELSNYRTDVSALFSFIPFVAKATSRKHLNGPIIPKGEDTIKFLIEDLTRPSKDEKLIKLGEAIQPISDSLKSRLSTKVTNNYIVSPSITILVSKTHMIILSGSEGVGSLDNEISMAIPKDDSVFEMLLPNNDLFLCLKLSDLRYGSFGSGFRYVFTAMYHKEDIIDAVRFSCYHDPMSSFVGKNPPHYNISELKPLPKLNKSKLVKLYGDF